MTAGSGWLTNRKFASAVSAASSAFDHVCDWMLGTPPSPPPYPPPYLPLYPLLTPLLPPHDPTPQARKFSSAMSAASSACDHVRDWMLGTPEGTWVSMGVYSDGSYGQPEGLMYSFPCTCTPGGKWDIVQGLEIDGRSAEKMRVSAEELAEERELALQCIGEAAA